ncbi:MAG: hypothetical protein WDN46_18045 [Methylocella sp.]
MRKAILVLGMHRSGTSAVAGVMAQLGIAAPLTLMPATSDNERGYWESLRLAALHDELLASAGGKWDDWRAFDREWHSSASADHFKARAKPLLEEEFGKADLFVFKDPRICRILPFWTTVLEEMQIAPLVVIPIRSPLEVARSLAKRDGFSLEKGLLIWLRHVLDAERETRHLPRAIVAMDDLFEDWRGAMTKIGRLLEIEWPAFDETIAVAIDNFISRDLRHQTAPTDGLPAMFAWTIKAYDAMLALRDQPRSRLALGVLDEVSATFELACAFMGPAFAEIEAKVAHVGGEAASLRSQRDELSRKCDGLAALLNQRKPSRNGLDKPVLEERLINLAANRERAQRRLQSIQVTLAAAATQI